MRSPLSRRKPKTILNDNKNEISELEALVLEIKEKIDNTKDIKKEAESKPKGRKKTSPSFFNPEEVVLVFGFVEKVLAMV